MNILLIEPKFPIPPKSKNHKDFLPIGLLKLACYYKSQGHKVSLIRGNIEKEKILFKPDKIMVTSLFTYWSIYVKETVQHYKNLFPDAKIIVGGIYASLMPKHCKKYTGCDEVFVGIHENAENYAKNNLLDYNLVSNPHPIDYQIVHGSRGCIRKCNFCGTWKIEPKFIPKNSIKNEIQSNKLIFYDNNFLANPHIEQLLEEISQLRYKEKPVYCESQSGFDGRILLEKPHLTKLLKKARFKNVRIAWDHGYSEWKIIKKQLDLLTKAGYPSKAVYVFMIYNFEHDFLEMEKKRIKCWEWKFQIADCRYRPLKQTFDNYNSKKEQTNKDYFIHPKWTDAEVKQFRKNIRRQNICVRQGFDFHSKMLEQKRIDKRNFPRIKHMPKSKIIKAIPDAWYPDQITPPKHKE